MNLSKIKNHTQPVYSRVANTLELLMYLVQVAVPRLIYIPQFISFFCTTLIPSIVQTDSLFIFSASVILASNFLGTFLQSRLLSVLSMGQGPGSRVGMGNLRPATCCCVALEEILGYRNKWSKFLNHKGTLHPNLQNCRTYQHKYSIYMKKVCIKCTFIISLHTNTTYIIMQPSVIWKFYNTALSWQKVAHA